jgi:hypothetical protein
MRIRCRCRFAPPGPHSAPTCAHALLRQPRGSVAAIGARGGAQLSRAFRQTHCQLAPVVSRAHRSVRARGARASCCEQRPARAHGAIGHAGGAARSVSRRLAATTPTSRAAADARHTARRALRSLSSPTTARRRRRNG